MAPHCTPPSPAIASLINFPLLGGQLHTPGQQHSREPLSPRPSLPSHIKHRCKQTHSFKSIAVGHCSTNLLFTTEVATVNGKLLRWSESPLSHPLLRAAHRHTHACDLPPGAYEPGKRCNVPTASWAPRLPQSGCTCTHTNAHTCQKRMYLHAHKRTYMSHTYPLVRLRDACGSFRTLPSKQGGTRSRGPSVNPQKEARK